MMSVTHGLSGAYPELGRDIHSRLDVLGDRELWRDFEQGSDETEQGLKETLVLAGNWQTSSSSAHSFLPSSFTASPVCLSYRSHLQGDQSARRRTGRAAH